MARIVLTGNLRLYTEGVTELELESGSIRSLLRELRRRYPDIPEDIEDELAISIDGVPVSYTHLTLPTILLV